ncbi:hypothetical protein AUK13_02580 [Candidatus Kuenenbacteria bacterium CG2_30_39_24]|uniref:DUF86 domain-containing protein n=1 Tax=Candidatus Kuenenbacteria bacterium CG2_30_39_24 TaxID=1805236 RepID=A0A1J5FKY0_9BACT|nr:MAG: hypothetical protein AUK13_02580 [Candidatus Kuenenbacteria bacterium CG2_30_39_24]
MVDKKLVKNKLADLAGYYKELKLLINEPVKEILDNNLKLRSVERLFQLVVDAAIDINTHLIAESDIKVPDDYQSTFITLAENKFLPLDFAVKIAPSVGLRNLIVHKYSRVDSNKMIEDVKKDINQYLEYMRHINQAID